MTNSPDPVPDFPGHIYERRLIINGTETEPITVLDRHLHIYFDRILEAAYMIAKVAKDGEYVFHDGRFLQRWTKKDEVKNE